MNSYYELQIKINPDIAEILSDFCFENLKCEGVVLAEETYKDLELVSTTEGTLKIYSCHPELVSGSLLQTFRNTLKSRGFSNEDLGTWEISINEVENQDWSQKWKEKWDVTHVSDKITVVPEWIEYTPKAGEIVINLDPGSAFGTGTHPTTQLCMRGIEKYMSTNARMADIGTGSGILAICASKLGASYVYGCDNDEAVIPVAIENARKNGIPHVTLNSFQGLATDTGGKMLKQVQHDKIFIIEQNTTDKITEKFDFVCANILHNVLAQIMGDLKNIMNPGATLVLSGILNEKKQVVIDAILKYDLEIAEETHQDQWVALVVQRV